MKTTQTLPSAPRATASERLRLLGVTGRDLHLLDVVPLVEMVWADGEAQPEEWAIVDRFLRKHVARVNRHFDASVLSVQQGKKFVARLGGTSHLRMLRELVPSTVLAGPETALARLRHAEIIEACIDIGAACSLPHDPSPFSDSEKACLRAILRTLQRSCV